MNQFILNYHHQSMYLNVAVPFSEFHIVGRTFDTIKFDDLLFSGSVEISYWNINTKLYQTAELDYCWICVDSCPCTVSVRAYCLFLSKQSVLEFKQWAGSLGSIRHCYILTSQSDWVSSISGEQPSLLLHGSLHQGLFYLDRPGPWPPEHW